MSDDFAPARGRKNRPAKRAVGASPYDEGAKGLMDDQEMAEAKDIVLEPMTDVCEVSFAPLAEGEVTDAHLKPAAKMSGKGVVQIRKIGVPPNRISPLKKEWVNLTTPLVKEMKLAVQFNRKSKQVLLVPAWVVSAEKKEPTESEARLLEIYLEKACLYVKGFLLGFSLSDCMALLRLDDIYLQSFQVIPLFIPLPCLSLCVTVLASFYTKPECTTERFAAGLTLHPLYIGFIYLSARMYV